MDIVLSLLVIAAIALLFAAWFAWRRGNRLHAALMVVLAMVAALNVLIWTLPDTEGTSPIEKLDAAKSSSAGG